MGRFIGQLVRGLFICVCAGPVAAIAAGSCDDSGAEALALLEQMSRSGMAVGHQGMATLRRGGDIRVLKIHRSSDAGTVTDTLTLLTGEGSQMVQAEHSRDCTRPGHSLLRLPQGDETECGVAAYYRLSMEPGERVAGRATQRVTVRPRDMYRYGHVLELDTQTAQLLRATTLTRDGRPLEQFQYASLVLSPGGGTDDDDSAVATYRHPACNSGRDASGQSAPASARWEPEWLPAGFVATQDNVDGSRQTYTDGMASFSIFLEPMATDMQPGEGAIREGSTIAYTRGMRLAGSQVLITVVGEVPLNTARMVADSVALR
mgnify:CR=1 FL=1